MTTSYIESHSLPDQDDDEGSDEKKEDAKDNTGDGNVSGLTTQHSGVGKLALILGALGLKQHTGLSCLI